MNQAEKLAQMRKQMAKVGVDAVIIPQTDPHQSEYIADHWQVRRYLSGFTGSAGTLVITADKALLWADSRYFIQAAQQLAGTEIELMKDGLASTPSIEKYLVDNLQRGMTVGIDGMLFSVTRAKELRKALEAKGLKLDTNCDLIDNVWTDRPALPKDKIFVHDEKYAGENTRSKIDRILKAARQKGGFLVFISALDEIAWVLNIRCKDVKFNPVTTAYLTLAPNDENTLYVDPDKLTPDTKAYLDEQGVRTRPYDDIKLGLECIFPHIPIYYEEARTSITLAELVGNRAVVGESLVAVPKGVKNDVQIAGIRAAMERDGVALVKAFMALEDKLAKGEKITELGVDKLLAKYRSEQDLFFDESFGSIVGYAGHGAIVHYEPTPESDATLEPNGLLLVDSGAQYFDGTTDITRTVCLGTPTQMEKHDFTLVMKGHIALAQAIFPVDTRGAQLDVLARQFLWREGLSYLHGTGHGVGHFLNVHEGPQSIRLNNTPTPLMAGMITSNEPGLYRENIHGIRCENLVLTVPAMTTEFGEFLKFETLTLYPFDRALFETEIMTESEIKWVNDYHAEVYRRLSPALTVAEQDWLKAKTEKL